MYWWRFPLFNQQRWPIRPLVDDTKSHLDGGCEIITRKDIRWTIVGLESATRLYTMKISYKIKDYVHCIRYKWLFLFCSNQTPHILSFAVVDPLVWLLFPLYILYILLNLFSSSICLKYLPLVVKQQTVNLLTHRVNGDV